MDELRVLVASGDSVGHLSHAAVILDALAERHPLRAAVTLPHNAGFRSWIERRGYPVKAVGTGIGENREFSARDLLLQAPALAASTLGGLAEAARLLGRFRPHLVLGTGGRASFAPMAAATLRRYPTVTVPHYALRRANHALAYLVDRTCLAREADISRFPPFLRGRLRVTHTPLRPDAFVPVDAGQARRTLGLDPDRPVVALIGYSGGSAGTTRLFVHVLRLVRAARPDVQAVVQYGGYAPAGEDRALLEEAALARPFFPDLLSIIPACDLAVTAAGETTLLELCARGVPAICAPVPDTPIGPHIDVLVRDLEARGAVLRPAGADARSLADSILRLLGDPSARRRIGEAARGFVDANATASIVGVIEELLQHRTGSRQPDAPVK